MPRKDVTRHRLRSERLGEAEWLRAGSIFFSPHVLSPHDASIPCSRIPFSFGCQSSSSFLHSFFTHFSIHSAKFLISSREVSQKGLQSWVPCPEEGPGRPAPKVVIFMEREAESGWYGSHGQTGCGVP